jgi:hypothetical protein
MSSEVTRVLLDTLQRHRAVDIHLEANTDDDYIAVCACGARNDWPENHEIHQERRQSAALTEAGLL